MEYYDIFRGLEDAEVDYLVVGGVAVNLHGVPRMTYDLDIMIGLDKENIQRALELLHGWGYEPAVPVNPRDFADSTIRSRRIREKNMKAFGFRHPSQPVAEIDLVFDSPRPFAELKGRAVTVAFRDLNLPVVSLDDLVAMKEISDRSQDKSDAEALRKIRRSP